MCSSRRIRTLEQLGILIAPRSRMSEPTKRKPRRFRAPFLVTIGAVAGMLVPACGGNVSGNNGNSAAGGSSGTGGGGTGGAVTSGGGTGGNAGDCPSVLPQDGASCVMEGRYCPYRACLPE